ncbi:hypothetical protein IQ241_11730 [Romeria aff. gracilis LEGE 07310]|uniref:Uncharacterized protein n=1 Tax=Vasconcelosia minhoensis LEGE 07310 TaxID=915328 RepID=A0A8J7AEM4_9CYAN|nr:hypothetical protein [Romeria gracilis]MBE9077954.1 hypothetical protein [Romeria aff. gracilis LEGE 07310]
MTPKDELIQAIERSPDDLVWALLGLLRVLKRQQLPEAVPSAQEKTVLERMGGEPKRMLSVGGLSDRDCRRDLISMRLQQKYSQDNGLQGLRS